MEKKFLVLRPLAIWMVVASILSIITVFLLTFYYQQLSSVAGFLLLLVVIFLAVYELGTVRSLWMSQEGEWGSILRAIGVNIPFRAYFVFLLWNSYTPHMVTSDRNLLDAMLILNVATLIVETYAFALVLIKKSYFQPSQEEVENVLRRVQTTVKASDSCPNCKEIVEADWCCCPNCGTELPRFCASCNAPVRPNDIKCSECGAEVAKIAAIESLIATLKNLAEEPASSETRSVRYARLGEALLKGGRLDEAIEAYRTAIHYTQFDRKRTNFMVKMAVIYNNSGKVEEAGQMLDAALQLDPEDWAGAAKKKESLGQCGCATKA